MLLFSLPLLGSAVFVCIYDFLLMLLDKFVSAAILNICGCTVSSGVFFFGGWDGSIYRVISLEVCILFYRLCFG